MIAVERLWNYMQFSFMVKVTILMHISAVAILMSVFKFCLAGSAAHPESTVSFIYSSTAKRTSALWVGLICRKPRPAGLRLWILEKNQLVYLSFRFRS